MRKLLTRWAAPAILVALASCLPAQTFTTLFNFYGGPTNGSNPVAPMVQGADGNFYGTTQQGGPACFSYGSLGCGTVFKITPKGVLTTLYYFCSVANCADGAGPNGLILAESGVFYGTTRAGGSAGGWGTVFRITPKGELTTIYTFCASGTCTDGGGPSGLLRGNNGAFYGTTDNGGTYGMGSAFQITPGGVLTTLYSFCALASCADGSLPRAGLLESSPGGFFGTTQYGGAYGWGAIFDVFSVGSETPIYSFCASAQPGSSDCPDGSFPQTALTLGSNGNFYGTTNNGGSTYTCSFGCGTIFETTPNGTLSTLHSFSMTDGANPFSQLVLGSDKIFYGTTTSGGTNDQGTVFQITPAGVFKTLHSFVSTDGASGEGLVQGTNGSFYGVTAGGGTAIYYGTVFKLSVGLGEFVRTVPGSALVGAPVRILGTDLTGATAVTFNGVAATFTVPSSSGITTTVPAGATSGVVQVTTPSGTLSSNVAFRVLQ